MSKDFRGANDVSFINRPWYAVVSEVIIALSIRNYNCFVDSYTGAVFCAGLTIIVLYDTRRVVQWCLLLCHQILQKKKKYFNRNLPS